MDVDRKLEETVEEPKRRGWPKGKPRKPKAILPLVPEPVEPPIHVRVVRKGMDPFEFGCARHFVENGFHVFVYPSKRDPYRQTRREIAISEVIDIEITQAAEVYQPQAQPMIQPTFIVPEPYKSTVRDGRPVIHNAKEDALRRMAEKAEETVKVNAIPGISFGDSVG